MEASEFFRITGLRFEDKRPQTIETAIQAAIKKITNEIGSGTGVVKRSVLDDQIKFLQELLLAPDRGERVKSMAGKAAAQATAQLKGALDILYRSGRRRVSRGFVKRQEQLYGLAENVVKDAVTAAGFTIAESVATDARALFPTNAREIENALAALRKTPDPNPNGADTGLVEDMFAFVAYLEGEPEQADVYRRKTAAELKRPLDARANALQTQHGALSSLLKDLCAKGRNFIFNSQENLEKYRAYLRFRSPELTELFAKNRGMPREALRDPDLAESAIRVLLKYFPKYETALCLYNYGSGISDDPYEGVETPPYCAQCGSCLFVCQFSSAEEARRRNKCTNCGKPLFKPCPNCGKPVPGGVERCPECGFDLAAAQELRRALAAGEAAFLQGDYNEAAAQAARALAIAPGDRRAVELQQRIAAQREKSERPLRELETLLDARRYSAALERLARLQRECPGLNVSAFRSRIEAARKRADADLEGVRRAAGPRRAELCLDILDLYADYQPALELLRTEARPSPCTGLTVTGGRDDALTIAFQPTGERGVQYTLVRKNGATPQGPADGTVLAQGLRDTTFQDRTVEPGQVYGYAVFAVRCGAVSAPAGCRAVLYAEVSALQHRVDGDRCHIAWQLPKNSVGADLLRVNTATGAQQRFQAGVSFSDTLEYGAGYVYTVFARYMDGHSSHGLRFSVLPMPRVAPFDIACQRDKEGRCRISWSLRTPGLKVKLAFDGRESDVLMPSESGGCTVPLRPGRVYQIQAFASSGGEWVKANNDLLVNTYPPVDVDRKNSAILPDRICIRLAEPLPKSLTAIYYAVRTKTREGQPAPWLTIEEISRRDPSVHRLSREEYAQVGELVSHEQRPDTDDHYCTLYGVYGVVDGRPVLGAPRNLKLTRPLDVTVEYRVKRQLLRGGGVLTLRFSARRLTHLPRLLLCWGARDSYLRSPDDPGAQRLLDIPQEELPAPVTEAERTYPLGGAWPGEGGPVLFVPDAPDSIHYRLIKI